MLYKFQAPFKLLLRLKWLMMGEKKWAWGKKITPQLASTWMEVHPKILQIYFLSLSMTKKMIGKLFFLKILKVHMVWKELFFKILIYICFLQISILFTQILIINMLKKFMSNKTCDNDLEKSSHHFRNSPQ